MSVLSMVGDGHTVCFPDLVTAWNQSLPVRFEIFRERLFIISAAPPIADLVGAQVLRFGEQPWERVLAELGRIISKDNAQAILRAGPNYMRYPQILHGLGLQPDADVIQLTVRGLDGEERTVTVDAVPNDPRFNRILGHPDWATVYQGSPAPLPLYLKDRRTPYWFEHLADEKLVYFQFNSVSNATTEPFDRFVDRLFAFIDEHDVRKLVIDLRWNNGGNTLLLPS